MASNKKKYESGSKVKKRPPAAPVKKLPPSSTPNKLKTVTVVKNLKPPTVEKVQTVGKVKKSTVRVSQQELVPSLTSKEYNLSGSNKTSKSFSLENYEPRAKKSSDSPLIGNEILPTIGKFTPLAEPPQLILAKKVVSGTPLKNLKGLPTFQELCPALAQKITTTTTDKKQVRLPNGSILTIKSDQKHKQPGSEDKKFHFKNIAEIMSPICKRKELISVTLAKNLAANFKELKSKIDMPTKKTLQSQGKGIVKMVKSPQSNLPVPGIKEITTLSTKSMAATQKSIKKIPFGKITGKKVVINSKKKLDSKEPLSFTFERRMTKDTNLTPVSILKKSSVSKDGSVSLNNKYTPDSRTKKISVATGKNQGVTSINNNKATPIPQVDKLSPRNTVKEQIIWDSKDENPESNVKKVCPKKAQLISEEKISSNNSSRGSKASVVSKKTDSISNSFKNNSISSQDKVSNKNSGTRISVTTKGSNISGQSRKTKISMESQKNASTTNSKTNESGNMKKTDIKCSKYRT